MLWHKQLVVLIGIFICVCSAKAQVKILKGVILDKQSDEPIPYASAVFKKSGIGVLSDSLGKFTMTLPQLPVGDTLQVNNVGYKPTLIPVSDIKDSSFITIYIEVLPPQHEAIVKVKYNRALWFWRKIQAHKEKNDKLRWDNYGYEVYNKLELDLNKVNKEKLEKNFVLKPFNFILDYTDTTSEKEPFLPVYLTETISDYYYQKQPNRTREVIKARNAWGFTNESLAKQ